MSDRTCPLGEGIHTRLLGPADAEAYALLRREALERHPLAFGSGPACDLQELRDTFRAHAADPSRFAAYGAFAGEGLVGIGRLYRRTGLKETHKCEIVGMYVTAAHRRRGVGRALLRALLRHARTWSGVTHVYISVTDAAPEAARLYESEGFRRWGSEPAALRWQGTTVAEHHMALALGS